MNHLAKQISLHFPTSVQKMGWNWLHGFKVNVLWDILYHLQRPFRRGYKKSDYYFDAFRYYRSLDVHGKLVLDIGCDRGVTPMYFLNHGAKEVIGFSLTASLFSTKYRHYQVTAENFPEKIREMIWNDSTLLISYSIKSDCEGGEYSIPVSLLENATDWVICLHKPVPETSGVLQYILNNGTVISHNAGNEFLVVRKDLNRGSIRMSVKEVKRTRKGPFFLAEVVK